MYSKTFILCSVAVSLSCNFDKAGVVKTIHLETSLPDTGTNVSQPFKNINEIPLPGGFKRLQNGDDSFAGWLRSLPLKKSNIVYIFNGKPKGNQSAQYAVLDITVGDKDLQQCADAVMRLRGEYLFAQKKYQAIRFSDNAGKVYQFNAPYSYNNLQLYFRKIFGMCGSASLAKQLSNISFRDIEPGDVLIRGGFPGHAVMVMDVAVNRDGQKIYLLAQSYMPAQDIHVLVNPVNKSISPWYEVNENKLIETPEYTFRREELKRW